MEGAVPNALGRKAFACACVASMRVRVVPLVLSCMPMIWQTMENGSVTPVAWAKHSTAEGAGSEENAKRRVATVAIRNSLFGEMSMFGDLVLIVIPLTFTISALYGKLLYN
jgi:hypothetical protein